MMRLSDRIVHAFEFLIARGYKLVSRHDAAMGGDVTFRSDSLWIAIEWDRDESPTLAIAPTQQSFGRVPWDNVDHLIRGVARYECEPPLLRTATLGELADFIRRHVAEIETRFSPPQRADTDRFLQELEADRSRRVEAYWQSRAASGPGA